MLACWHVGMLACWHVGMLACWHSITPLSAKHWRAQRWCQKKKQQHLQPSQSHQSTGKATPQPSGPGCPQTEQRPVHSATWRQSVTRPKLKSLQGPKELAPRPLQSTPQQADGIPRASCKCFCGSKPMVPCSTHFRTCFSGDWVPFAGELGVCPVSARLYLGFGSSIPDRPSKRGSPI